MTTTASPTPVVSRRALRSSAARHRSVVDLAVVLVGLGFGATIGLGITAESRGALHAAGGLDMAIGRVAGLAAGYALLVMLLLMARIPLLERAAGQDRLAHWHRRIGGWPIVLIALHATFITFGYAASSGVGFWSQSSTFIHYYPDLLAAMVAFALLVAVGVLSASAARKRLRYETWWAIHLYVYLALGLGFAHQIATGVSFVGHPLTREVWAGAWIAAAASVLTFRFGLPLWRTLRHQLRVVTVRVEGPDVISVICSGRKIDRLRVEGGQFFQWRFLAKGLWWQAHPYSLSALPAPPYVRLTARALGDHSTSLLSLHPGTRVAVEGPYGIFTANRRAGERVLLVGAGVGVTPIRAMLEDLPASTDVTVIVRASKAEDLVLHNEMTQLVERRGGQMHEVLGPRASVHFELRFLQQLVPDIAKRDLYVCGPEGFGDKVVDAARHLGVAGERIHRESFAF